MVNPLLIVKKDENIEWKEEDIDAFNNIMIGYRECMPNVDDILLNFRFHENSHFLNIEFSHEPKYFIAFDDSKSQQGIVVISALYVFPKYRNRNFGKMLIGNLQSLAKNNIVLQVAVNKDKHQSLVEFYKKMGFMSTGKVNAPDALGISYIDFFWANRPIKLTAMSNSTKIEFLNNTNSMD